eukprot:2146474-Amphidinium_carterae.1
MPGFLQEPAMKNRVLAQLAQLDRIVKVVRSLGVMGWDGLEGLQPAILLEAKCSLTGPDHRSHELGQDDAVAGRRAVHSDGRI